MTSAADRRAELHQWIAETRINQRRLAGLLAAGAGIALALLAWRSDIGGAALGLLALIAFIGFWITSSHLQDFRARLDHLDSSR
jgi:drug/metabolite transporter (DMT)-like permease